MNSYDVVFQFLCPNCRHIGVGQQVFEANTPDQASRMLSTIILPCSVCHQSVKKDVTAKTYVFTSAPVASESTVIGPAVP